MESRAGRALRGWSVAVVATLLAAVSHGIADGAMPSLLGLGASLVLAGAASTILTPRGQSLWRLALAVAISQIGFHTVFSSFGAGSTLVPNTSQHGTAHGSLHVGSSDVGAALAGDLPTGHGHASMTLAHIVAGLLTLILLRTAESAAVALVRVVRLVVRRLVGRVEVPIVGERPRPVAATATLPTLRSLLALAPDRYRGPPVVNAAA
jgi:hypothetical protein